MYISPVVKEFALTSPLALDEHKYCKPYFPSVTKVVNISAGNGSSFPVQMELTHTREKVTTQGKNDFPLVRCVHTYGAIIHTNMSGCPANTQACLQQELEEFAEEQEWAEEVNMGIEGSSFAATPDPHTSNPKRDAPS